MSLEYLSLSLGGDGIDYIADSVFAGAFALATVGMVLLHDCSD